MNNHSLQIFSEDEEIQRRNNENTFEVGEESNLLGRTSTSLTAKSKKKIDAKISCVDVNSTDFESLVYEPRTAWKKGSPVTKVAKTAIDSYVGRVSASEITKETQTNGKRQEGMKVTTAMSSPLKYYNPQAVINQLLQRQRFMTNRDDDSRNFTKDVPIPLHATMREINVRIDSDYFVDGKELERNVIIDCATNRSYVYTTDLERKWMLPEFLYLDVPNSTYAARACGHFVTNKLVSELKQMVKPGSKQPKVALEGLVKNCNKSEYEVQNILVPNQPRPHGFHRIQHGTSPRNEISVQSITTKFRLRYAKSDTHIHKMLSQNFMNGNRCARGILVFIPSMEEGSSADRFWGSLEDVKGLPKANDHITNAKMDRWCTHVAKQHGTYRGKDPELMGRTTRDHHRVDSYSKNRSLETLNVTNLSANAALGRINTKTTAKKVVKVGPAKKKVPVKKKMAKLVYKNKNDPQRELSEDS